MQGSKIKPFLLLALVSLVGCQREVLKQQEGAMPQPQRYAMVIGLKPEKVEYYKKLHAEPWPDVLKQITQANIQNYSIHIVELKQGEYYLFGYLDYTGNDFEADMQAMADDAETVRWWKETDPCQTPIETAKEGDQWTMMQEVFYHP